MKIAEIFIRKLKKIFGTAAFEKSLSKKILAAIFIACALSYPAVNMPATQRNVLYPFPYRDKVEKYSSEFNADKYLAISVMKVESNFTEGAISRTGAVGLMQIMPETAGWIATRLDEEPPTINRLHETDTNIKYGIWYLSELNEEFFGNDVLTLAAYNAGRGNVRTWMEEKGWDENFYDIDSIPFSETRKYVRRVLECRKKYNELYEQSEGEDTKNFLAFNPVFACSGK